MAEVSAVRHKRLKRAPVLVASSRPEQAAYFHIYVSDVDATYQRALTAGATSVQEPVKKDCEDERGGVRVAGGTTWWIATGVGSD